ncbi:TolC family protein [Candidatus Poribacteria bacterium]
MRKLAFVVSCLIFIFSALLLDVSFAQEKLSLTLEKCVEMTLENNEQILKAGQELAEAEGVLTTARSDEYLQLNFTSWYEQSKNDGNFEAKDYNGTISAEQLLLRFGEVPRRIDDAQERLRLAELKVESARIDEVSNTRRIFYDIVLIQDELRERKILRDEIDKKRARTADRVKERLALELELLDVELELSDQDLSINTLKRALRVRKTELLQAIGADEEADIDISGELSDLGLTMDDFIAAAMAKRTELKDLRGQIVRQERLTRESYWELLPELRSSYRYKDTSFILQQEDRTWDALLAYEKPIWEKEGGRTPERDKWEFNFGLSFPMFDGFRVKGIVEAEQARLAALRIELLRREKQIRLEVRRAYQDVADDKENMEILERRVTFRRKTLERMEAIMETPVISQKYPHLAGITFDDVIRAREDYTNAQKGYFDQKRRYMQARENLRQKMGIVE